MASGRLGGRGGQRTVPGAVGHHQRHPAAVAAYRVGVAARALPEQCPGDAGGRRHGRVLGQRRPGAAITLEAGHHHRSAAVPRADLQVVGQPLDRAEADAQRAARGVPVAAGPLDVGDPRPGVDRHHLDRRRVGRSDRAQQQRTAAGVPVGVAGDLGDRQADLGGPGLGQPEVVREGRGSPARGARAARRVQRQPGHVLDGRAGHYGPGPVIGSTWSP
jgi:hypothetical protein